jgi:hypothetical protein
MKVQSQLANMDIRIGAVHRAGNELLLQSAEGSSVQTTIAVSAREALSILGRVLGSAGGLSFVLGLPFFWLRQVLSGDQPANGAGAPAAGPSASQGNDINKPW